MTPEDLQALRNHALADQRRTISDAAWSAAPGICTNKPRPTAPTGIEALVCADIAARQSKGLVKYGTTVADNPLPLRAWLEHQYQELLDAAVYCRRAMAEIDRNEPDGR